LIRLRDTAAGYSLPEYMSPGKKIGGSFGAAACIKVKMEIFDEHYRVVAVAKDRLTIRGVRSGNLLVVNAVPDSVINEEEYPLGKLIALTDPSTARPN
jgi:hypothetical protein